MKKIQFIILALSGLLMTSCMGSDYADAEYEENPYGNNSLTETNVVTINDLKNDDKYKNVIANSAMKTITDDIQIKGYVTGNDVQGNIYNQFALQDETGALLVSVAQGGIHGYLPVGQQVLISLKDMVIGGYGAQCQIGGIYTNANTGAQSVGRMSRLEWAKHYKILGFDADAIQPEEFNTAKLSDTDYMKENAGKLMTISNVTISEANGKRVFAPNDSSATITANAVNRTLKGLNSSKIVLRTSIYADFANEVMPTGAVNITGIFTRYRNTWQILMRSIDDIEAAPTAILSETFGESQGDFTINDIYKADGLDYVWSFSSYGMKATAYVGGTNYASQSRLVSPVMDLSSVESATLSFDQAGKYFSNVSTECRIQVSTDGETWEDLTPSNYLDGSSWDYINTTCDLTSYCGNETVYIGFLYTSTDSSAPTWEIKNVVVE